jgi:SAM-dependent methyltransferase
MSTLSPDTSPEPQFDAYAAAYDQALEQGLSVSGETKDYFAHGRLLWSAKCLRECRLQSRAVLDFGCGTGSATPFIRQLLQPEEMLGVDVSTASLEVARQQHAAGNTRFELLRTFKPDGRFDFAYCNGVFHHIPLEERAAAVACVVRSLRPGGIFAFWENNPWNPGTRYVMSRIPFDREAVTLTAPEARRLLQGGGFKVLHTTFLFVFPRLLKWFRPFEPALAFLPLGAQYQMFCRKPG